MFPLPVYGRIVLTYFASRLCSMPFRREKLKKIFFNFSFAFYLYFSVLRFTESHIELFLSQYRRFIGLWPADFLCPMPDLWLTCDHFLSKLSAVGQPTRTTQLSI